MARQWVSKDELLDFLGEEITYRDRPEQQCQLRRHGDVGDRPGGALRLHRPGEEVAGVGRLANPT